MASAADMEASMKPLYEDGLLDLNDQEVGDLVAEMERRNFAFLSPYGLDYCEKHVLKDTRIKPIIVASLRHCTLAHWLRYTDLPGHIECFRKGGQEAGLRRLIVEQWSKGSQVDYYGRSHLHDLPTVKGARGLHETSRDALKEAGCPAIPLNFVDGGLIIRDARLYREIKAGYAITFILATEGLDAWPKMIIPNSPSLVRKIVSMESDEVKINFEIKDSTSKK